MKLFNCPSAWLFASLTSLITVFSPLAHSAVTPQSRGNLCSLTKDLSKAQKILQTRENRLTFGNNGGLLNGGVCWWYSRFERNAAYLTFYRPDLPQPTHEEAVALIAQIRSGAGIVQIPGFSNLSQFSNRYATEIESALSDWQMSEGVLGLGWLNGLASDSVSAEQLNHTMAQTYDLVKTKKRVVFLMLKFPGIVSHSWLVLSMAKTPTGYLLGVEDSNFPGSVQIHNYDEGMTQMDYYSMSKMVPYLSSQYLDEGEAVIQTLKSSCARR